MQTKVTVWALDFTYNQYPHIGRRVITFHVDIDRLQGKEFSSLFCATGPDLKVLAEKFANDGYSLITDGESVHPINGPRDEHVKMFSRLAEGDSVVRPLTIEELTEFLIHIKQVRERNAIPV